MLTHGFVNDKDGKKMSKSKGNVTSPLDLMKTHGAEILRLWVILEDYRNDVNFSTESLERVSETYRKIRNTIRFMLSNLYDFSPDTDVGGVSRRWVSWIAGRFHARRPCSKRSRRLTKLRISPGLSPDHESLRG